MAFQSILTAGEDVPKSKEIGFLLTKEYENALNQTYSLNEYPMVLRRLKFMYNCLRDAIMSLNTTIILKEQNDLTIRIADSLSEIEYMIQGSALNKDIDNYYELKRSEIEYKAQQRFDKNKNIYNAVMLISWLTVNTETKRANILAQCEYNIDELPEFAKAIIAGKRPPIVEDDDSE